MLLSKFVARFYVEGILGLDMFYYPRISQWIFYSMLAAEYVINFNKVLLIRVPVNAISVFAILVLVMITHGTIVGVINNNPKFTIFNDIVPLLMIFLNILRMQSLSEMKEIDIERVFNFCAIIVLLDNVLGVLLYEKAPGSSMHYMVILIACILAGKSLRWYHYLLFLVPTILSIGEINRTTMLFLLISVSWIFVKVTLASPKKGVAVLIALIVGMITIVITIPKDSKTYGRIVGLQNIDLSQRTGSLGERQQEWHSISNELRSRGKTDEWLGFGMGGTFTMHFTYETMENYGHAHYSWAWFKLRFGNIGFVYLIIMVAILSINAINGFRVGRTYNSALGYTIALLCIYSVLYCMTYVNWIFLLSGLQFLAISRYQTGDYKES